MPALPFCGQEGRWRSPSAADTWGQHFPLLSACAWAHHSPWDLQESCLSDWATDSRVCANYGKGPPLSKFSPLLGVLGWGAALTPQQGRCPRQGGPGSGPAYLTPKTLYEPYKGCTYVPDDRNAQEIRSSRLTERTFPVFLALWPSGLLSGLSICASRCGSALEGSTPSAPG